MYPNNLNDKRIAIIGIGGVGGYLAGMLGKAYKHVTLAARGRRMKSIRENGLVLHSDYNGEITIMPEKTIPLEEMEGQDYIFICVKNYSLEEVCYNLRSIVDDRTVIIPVMNGANTGDKVRSIVKKGTVIDSMIYIITHANKDYSITQQGDIAKLKLGIQNANEEQRQKVEEVSAILSGANVDHEITQAIETEIWRKYIMNCAYNVTTAYYNNTIGQLRDSLSKAKEYEDLVREAYQVALAKGISITQKHIDEIIHDFYYKWADNATSSLQRDICMRKKSELDTFSGYLVREADRLAVSVPVSKRMYDELKKRDNIATQRGTLHE